MVTLPSLWLPIVLAAVLVFLGSSVVHMVLKYHNKDFAKVPREDGVMDALRPFAIPAGDYMLPYCEDSAEMRSEAFKAKVAKGPVAMLTVFDSAAFADMGPQLAKWFVYCLVVSVFAAYLAARTVGAGADYLAVFRVTGTVAFACYAMALPQRSIWYRQNWGSTLRSMFDGLLYACLTAGAFGWLWP